MGDAQTMAAVKNVRSISFQFIFSDFELKSRTLSEGDPATGR